jgi:sugar/nucleoside kinase (ribokinase family)
MAKIVTLGEIIVEIMAQERGRGFRSPLTLRGPFPSGAPAIFIDQAGRLGEPCGIIGCVGDDDFGRMTTDRLAADGVDISAVAVDRERVTGSAFVRYRDDGSRDFIFNIRHSAAARLALDGAARALLDDCRHFHIMGSSLFSGDVIEAAKAAIELVRQRGGTISFDPNIRKEMLQPAMREALGWMVRHCDVFLPSGAELTLLTAATNEEAAVRELFDLGVSRVVAKRGAAGARCYDRTGALDGPGFAVRELDPTGAGDCFGATFVTCGLRGMSTAECLRYANASGARAVCVRGPMEGTSTFAELDAFIAGAVGTAP